MIGLAGDAKNTGSLIVNNGVAPAQMGDVHNPRAGLLNAGKQIMQSLDEANLDALVMALEAFIKMTKDIAEMENRKDHKPEMENLEPGGF